MNQVLMVCSILVTLAIVLAAVYFIQTLIQIRKSSKELEMLLKSINGEVDFVLRITGNISNFFDNLSSPWLKAGGLFASIISSFMRSGKSKTAPEHSKDK